MSERQVDLGMGQGLQPGSLIVTLPETSDCDVNKMTPSPRRQRTVTKIDPSRAIIAVDGGAAAASSSIASLSLQLQLDSALGEVEVLRQEIESYSKQLASKHSAIRILRQELKTASIQRDELQERNQKLQSGLTKEINRLQFELEYSQNNLADSQQTWSQRFDRVCQDNGKLQEALSARDNELRFLVEERSGLLSDRDELLALLDSSKREQWVASAPSLSAPLATIGEGDADIEAAEGRGAIELAVLGACACGPHSPCRCAHAAARLKRQVARSREEADRAHQRAEDAYGVVDAYRNAFEEQLTRNRNLTMRLGHLTASGSPESRRGRLRELVRWVGRQLQDISSDSRRGSVLRRSNTIENIGVSPANSLANSTWSICESVLSAEANHEDEESELRDMQIDSSKSREPMTPVSAARDLTEEQLTMLLLEKMCERAESSAHQRITARVLKRSSAGCGVKTEKSSASSGVFSSSSS